MHIHFEWDDSYRLGHPEIDEQHRAIVALANAISELDDKHVVQHAIMGLYRHTREHFGLEEELMTRLGYPGLREHREQHEELITHLEKLSSRPVESREAIRSFRLFVYKWVIDHLMEHDRQLIDWVNERSATPAP